MSEEIDIHDTSSLAAGGQLCLPGLLICALDIQGELHGAVWAEVRAGAVPAVLHVLNLRYDVNVTDR